MRKRTIFIWLAILALAVCIPIAFNFSYFLANWFTMLSVLFIVVLVMVGIYIGAENHRLLKGIKAKNDARRSEANRTT